MSVGIFPHVKPVLSVAHPYSCVEVTALEFAVKDQILASVIFFFGGGAVFDVFISLLVPLMVLK